MKSIIFSFTILLLLNMNAQNYPFAQKWQKIESQLNDGKLKSTQPLIDDVYKASIKENNTANLIKSLVFKSKIAIQTSYDEDIVLKEKNNIQSELNKAKGVEKAVMQSILAELFIDYFQENQYKIKSRTNLADNKSDDFRTWDTNAFLKEIDKLLTASLENKNLLSQTPIQNLEILMQGNEKWRFLRPSVYDVLANRAVDFYRDFMLENQEFNQTERNQKIESIFKNLIESHKINLDKSPLIEAELQLLLYKFAGENNRTELHIELDKLYKKYSNFEWSTHVLSEIAKNYMTNEEEEKRFVKAMKICDLAISKAPKSYGGIICNELKKQIKLPEIELNTDGTFYANKYNPLFIKHKNTDKLFYKIFKLNENQLAKNFSGFNYEYNKEKIITTQKPTKIGVINLKEFRDYESHLTKIPFEPFSSGNYIIIASNNKDFKGNLENHLLQTVIVSTEIDFSSRRVLSDNQYFTQIQVLDKNTSKPLSNQKVELFKINIDKKMSKVKTFYTDEFGQAKLKHDNEYYANYFVKIDKENTYFQVGINYNRYYDNEDNWEKYIKFFTDRAIYRPGQTVYFKGILYKTKDNKNKIAANEKVNIRLYDANNEKISDLSLVSNEFGSVNGEFVLPTSGMTGRFRVSDDWSDFSSKNIQVEEYKRPKFSVKIDTLKGSYKLNQKIEITGKAETFSGAKVSDAKVVYRVYRQAYNPYYYWWMRYQEQPEVEMTQGETTTDANGAFSFNFESIPAKPKQKNQNRTYLYKIVVDVVDISGETRTITSSLNVGDIPLKLDIKIPNKLNVKDFKSAKIISTNLNGTQIPAKGILEITEILPFSRVLRYEQTKVDYELISKKESIHKLPYISYENEHLPENKKRGKVLISESWNTANSENIKWEKELEAGIYELKAISILGNDTIEIAKTIELINPKQKSKNNNYFSVNIEDKNYQPGETAEISIHSDAENAFALIELEANEKIIKTEIIPINPENKFTFPIKESYRGGVFVNVYFSKYNSSKSITKFIKVPYDNKKLDISVSSLRDKIKPGDEETWTLTIKNNKGEKVLAEILAGMYDKSLDEFKKNPWEFFPYSDNRQNFSAWKSDNKTYFNNYSYYDYSYGNQFISYEELNLFGLGLNEFTRHRMIMNGMASAKRSKQEDRIDSGNYLMEVSAVEGVNEAATYADTPLPNSTNAPISPSINDEIETLDNVAVRKNLQETAFFFPNIATDSLGNVQIKFTAAESLTTWNFQAFAHTKELQTGKFMADIITQKELMVVPNAPRFLREGDKLIFKSKIINLSEKELNGVAHLQLFDAFTMKPIDFKFKHENEVKNFEVLAGGNTNVEWEIDVPSINDVQTVIYRVVAQSGNFSDGEENALPILSNRTMVTETMPIHVREGQNKTFVFDKLKNTQSHTRENFKLTMEMTTNPIWYAIMALPYLREYPYECSEQIFGRFYGNVISQQIVNSNPKIKAVFDDWNRKGQLISPLEKNQELKNILLEETPWINDSQNESEQMKRIAVLFDLNKMKNELSSTFRKLEQKQSANGGFPWFEGGRENFYITNHIVSGFGHLDKMGINYKNDFEINPKSMLKRSISYIDKEIEKDWKKYNLNKKRFSLSKYKVLYWLYARSYFVKEFPLNKTLEQTKNYFLEKIDMKKHDENLSNQALLSLVLYRFNNKSKAEKILLSLKDRTVESEEMGMYWKENISGYSWYEAPIETQALVIEAFDEVLKDIESVESMKVWLLKNKQTQQWNSTKATTEAVFALMNTGKSWINAEEGVTVKVGGELWSNESIEPKHNAQSGSGYIKQSWEKQEITSEKATVEVEKTSPGVAWGAMYWQYFEDLDKISGASTQVKFRKKLFIQRNTDKGPKLYEVTEKSPIKIGDLVKVRLEIQTDRAMEFVHIKDMRASGFEPVNVISQYKWQDSLGYYESTRDAATNFFIDYLPKGVYVFEYDLRANNAGDFSNGITQLQNMYAPEFSAHSKGKKLSIVD